MKLVRYFLEIMLSVALMLMVSCSSKKESSPSQVAEKAYACLQDRDYKGFVDLMDMDTEEGMSENEKEAQKAMMVALLEEKYEESVAQNGGIESYKVVDEVVDSTDMKATVTMEIKFVNSSQPQTENVPLVRVDGKWLISQAK